MSRRDEIRMSAAEVDAFLADPRVMNVASIGPDGRPHLVAMWYGFLEGAPALWTFGRSQKVVNIRRDPRVTCLVEDGDRYSELRGVQLFATAEVVDDPAVVLQLGEGVLARYEAAFAGTARPDAAAMSAKRVAVRLTVEDVVSWDHRKLGGQY